MSFRAMLRLSTIAALGGSAIYEDTAEEEEEEEEEEDASRSGAKGKEAEQGRSAAEPKKGKGSLKAAGGRGRTSVVPEKAAIDAVTATDCSYEPVPWSKRQKRMSANTQDMLRARQQGFNSRRRMSAPLGRGYIPNSICRPLGISTHKMFCGRFSTSGDVLLTASQDSVINLYDSQDVYRWSAKGPDPDVDHREDFIDREYYMALREYRASKVWRGAPKPIKTIQCLDTGWSVISTDFSPDERWLAYSSWSPYVHLCNTGGEFELHEALNFEPKGQKSFCLFSIQFSPSNTHILGGASDKCVYLYSLERKERVARIKAHHDDVNAVAFADQGSQVVLSGGDDCVIKAWDLRSPDKAVGGLCGHQAGVTCITAKGDGHHIISNGKDQTLKLWDLRKMLDPKDQKMVKAALIPQCDYRLPGPIIRRPIKSKRAADESIRTFHGHKVLQTLIRCYFSPMDTTGQSYVMSGSSDGRVCIWDVISGEMVRSLSWHRGNTRDVSWHPHLPLIASFSWDASVGLWSYNANREGVVECG